MKSTGFAIQGHERRGVCAEGAARGAKKGGGKAKKVGSRGVKQGFGRRKTSKFLRKIDIFEENEKFFEKGVDIRISRGTLIAVRRARDNRKEVRERRTVVLKKIENRA